jgi:Glycosyltransferase family 87
MSLVRRHPLGTIVAAGIGIRLVLAFALVGPVSDIAAQRHVADVLGRDFIHAYSANEQGWWGGDIFPAWPYPPLYFLWLSVASGLADLPGLPFHGVIHLLPIAADVGIAAAVYVYLGWRDADERLRLAGVALVMLGPSFIAVSGYHSQIDSVAILPAVLALMAWERRPRPTRAVDAGLLIGVAAAIKTVPALVLLAVLPAVRNVREATRLIVSAAIIPVAVLLPFVITDPGVIEWLGSYQGAPGKGGISMIVQPSLAWDWVTIGTWAPNLNDLNGFMSDNATAIILLTMAALVVFFLRYRPAPIDAAVLVWLAMYAFSPSFFIQYLVWGLPFFIMAGYLKQTAVIQAALLPTTVIYYFAANTSEGLGGLGPLFAAVYLATMIALWAFWLAAFATLVARIVGRARTVSDVQPPLIRLART